MIIRFKLVFILLIFFSQSFFAQTENVQPPSDSLASIIVDPFNHQDKLGQAVYMTFLDFERLGHFAEVNSHFTNNKTIRLYTKLFSEGAFVPNDLTKDTLVGAPISIDEYAENAKKHNGYFKYKLILEKKLINATRIDSDTYIGTYNLFKLFSENAVIDEAYSHGAVYKLELEFNLSGSEVKITNVTMLPDSEYHNFKLGKFGYTKDFRLLASNNLNSLIQTASLTQLTNLKPPKDSADYRAQPAIVFLGSYIIPDYLSGSGFTENINPYAGSSSTQSGWSTGLRLLLPLGKKGNLNLFFGLEYEQNNYNVQYNNLQFIYKTDVLGNPLEDLEGTAYDEKWVDVSDFEEIGKLTFIKPEVGLLYKIHFGEKIKLNLLGAVGYSYLSQSEFKIETTVSYRGKIYGFGDPISQEELGFYNDYKKTNFGEITNASSFYYFKYGGSLDFKLGKQNFLSLGFEIRTGLSPVLSAGQAFFPFLDPEINDTFLSSYTNVPEDRMYQSMAIVLSYKYQIRRK